MNTTLRLLLVSAFVITASGALPGCLSAARHRAAVRDDAADRLTVGTVQKDIRIGMTGAEVIAALGAPNIVTTDDERREVWTYDRIARETVNSSTTIGLVPLILGTNAPWAGGAAGNVSHTAGATAQTQRTLTVVVKFDAQKRVRDFAYHASSF